MGWLPEKMLLIIDVQQFLRDDKLGHGDPYLVSLHTVHDKTIKAIVFLSWITEMRATTRDRPYNPFVSLAFFVDFDNIYIISRCDQFPRIIRLWICKYGFCCAVFYNDAVLHHDEFIGECAHDPQVVADE